MNRQEVEKMFTPVEAKFLTETQKTMLMRIQRDFTEFATTLATDIPECDYRTQAIKKLHHVKMLCTQAVTHVGYEMTAVGTTKEIKHASKNKKTEDTKEAQANA